MDLVCFTNWFKFIFNLRGCNFDKTQWEEMHVHEKYNVSGSYHNKSELNRSIQAEKRAGKFYYF